MEWLLLIAAVIFVCVVQYVLVVNMKKVEAQTEQETFDLRKQMLMDIKNGV